MKKIFGNLFLAAVVLVGLSSSASAATCSNQAVTVGLSCSLGSLTFNFTNLSFAPASQNNSLNLVAATTGIVGNDVVLGFQINPGAAGFPVDILLGYTVTSTSNNIVGIDASYAGANGSIFENASISTPNGPMIVSNLTDGANNNGVIVRGNAFGPYSSVLISKDIHAISFSEFTDSVQVSGVPEPMTLSMMGAGLLGLSLISRRRKKS